MLSITNGDPSAAQNVNIVLPIGGAIVSPKTEGPKCRRTLPVLTRSDFAMVAIRQVPPSGAAHLRTRNHSQETGQPPRPPRGFGGYPWRRTRGARRNSRLSSIHIYGRRYHLVCRVPRHPSFYPAHRPKGDSPRGQSLLQPFQISAPWQAGGMHFTAEN